MPASRNRAFWVFIAIVVIAHFVLHLAIGAKENAPDLLTVAVLLSARRTRGSVAALIGFFLGILNDGLSPTAFGADAITLTIVGFLGARSRDLFEGESMLFVAGYLFLGKWLHDVIYFLLPKTEVRGELMQQLLIQAPLAALYAAGAGIFALLLYRASTGER